MRKHFRFSAIFSLLFVLMAMFMLPSCESCNRPAPVQPEISAAPADSNANTATKVETTDSNTSTQAVEVEGEGGK